MRIWAQGPAKPTTLGTKIRGALLDAGIVHTLEGPVVLRLRFVFRRRPGELEPIPGGASVAALARAVLDELPGMVYRDELQVAAVHARKEFGNVDGTEVSW